jgi:DNA-binding transcriptional ArsR family regulator
MSPNTDTIWDPTRLRLGQDGVARLNGGPSRGRKPSPIRNKFIAGPIYVSWVCQASLLGVKALLVGVALWHLKGLRRDNGFLVSNLMLQEWGIQPDAKTRALRALEKAGLITIDRRGKRSPRVTLIVGNTSNDGTVAASSGKPVDSFATLVAGTNFPWDPSRFRLDRDRVARLKGGPRRDRQPSPTRGKFIAGPVDVSWVCRASRLGVKALLVGLALWHLRGLRRSNISNLMLQKWGIQPDAKTRALRALEKAGLITLERQGKRSPRVTLIVGNHL